MWRFELFEGKISWYFIGVYIINTKIDQPIKIDGQLLGEVEELTYLGSKVTKFKEGGTSEDIKSRLQKARNVFVSLN